MTRPLPTVRRAGPDDDRDPNRLASTTVSSAGITDQKALTPGQACSLAKSGLAVRIALSEEDRDGVLDVEVGPADQSAIRRIHFDFPQLAGNNPAFVPSSLYCRTPSQHLFAAGHKHQTAAAADVASQLLPQAGVRHELEHANGGEAMQILSFSLSASAAGRMSHRKLDHVHRRLPRFPGRRLALRQAHRPRWSAPCGARGSGRWRNRPCC